MRNNYFNLYLMKCKECDIFEGGKELANYQNVRVMFEGYVNINKSRIPKKYLVPGRHYWCKYNSEDELSLMRYEAGGDFYSILHDVFWSSKNVTVIFEDYEH